MRKLMLGVLVSSLFGIGCGKSPCDKLKSEICSGNGDCEKKWDDEMKGDKEAKDIPQDAKDALCKAAMESKDNLEEMKKHYNKKKGGEEKKGEEKKDEEKKEESK